MIRRRNQKSLLALKMNPRKSLLSMHVLILLLSLVMSFLLYKDYLKQGVSNKILLLSILNFVFYVFSIYQIVHLGKEKARDSGRV